jgi:aminoglycoside phosphotransferase (APT) family kinase protein
VTAGALDAQAEDLRERVHRIVAARWTSAAARELAPLRGGQSSHTLLVTLQGAPVDHVVVKVAPPGLEPVGNRDVLRQAHALDAVSALPRVPVPDVLGRDPGAPPDVPPLFVMAFVEGDSCEPLMDREVRCPAADVTQRFVAAVRMLAILHAAPVDELGLGDEPVVELVHEVERWSRAVDTIPTELCPGAHDLAAQLGASVPPTVDPVLVHGDWRLGNMLAVGREIRAVIDWEIWSRSDPRLDLAWFLLGADPDHVSTVRRPEAVGVPTVAALCDEYGATGGELQDLPWFEALVRLKLAAVWGLIAKRELARPNPRAIARRFADWIPPTVVRGSELLARHQRSC